MCFFCGKGGEEGRSVELLPLGQLALMTGREERIALGQLILMSKKRGMDLFGTIDFGDRGLVDIGFL